MNLGESGALSRVLPVGALSGPLGTQVGPRFWAADGKGIVRLEGLPAGEHRFRLPDGETKEMVIAPEK